MATFNFTEKYNENFKLLNLIKRLKELRLQISREEKIKPYFIFNDKQMLDLISKMTKTKDKLMQVSGFGEVKVEN